MNPKAVCKESQSQKVTLSPLICYSRKGKIVDTEVLQCAPTFININILQINPSSANKDMQNQTRGENLRPRFYCLDIWKDVHNSVTYNRYLT